MMRIALVHDWLTGMRGGERVLEQLIALLPGAELFTLVHVPGSVSAEIERRTIHSSRLGRLPAVRHWYRHALPFFPAAIERFDLRGFDLIVSSSHCVAKGVRVPDGVPHLCYCHTPMRYLYDQSDEYTQRFSPAVRAGFALVSNRLRSWDLATASRVTHFIANSEHVRSRIERIYKRAAGVVHPPVAIDRFTPMAERGDYYMTVAALVPYKRLDLVVHAFNALGKKLIIVGTGPERTRLQRMAGPSVVFTGWIPDSEVAALLSGARGLVFAGVEDFGIALVEAQAAGAPVIAFAAGGALESVVDGETGVLFHEQTADAIAAAVAAVERRTFSTSALRLQAMRFRPECFRESMRRELERVLFASTNALTG